MTTPSIYFTQKLTKNKLVQSKKKLEQLNLKNELLEEVIRTKVGHSPGKNVQLQLEMQEQVARTRNEILTRHFRKHLGHLPDKSLQNSPEKSPQNPISFDDAIDKCMRLPCVSREQDFSKACVLYNREEPLMKVAHDVACVNFQNRGTDMRHAIVIVSGRSGIGKTRFGWEIAQLMRKQQFSELLKLGGSSSIVTKYVYMDFKPSDKEQFVKDLDSQFPPQVCLGLRLAARGLLKRNFLQILRIIKSGSRSLFTVTAVLKRIATLALQKESNGKILALVIHFDEFQFLVNSYKRHLGDENAGREALKDFVLCVRTFMHTGLQGTPWDKRVFVVPVFTGTVACNLSFFEFTHRITPVSVHLVPLTNASALQMFYSTFEGRYKKEFLNKVASEPHFQIALADTGYIPLDLVSIFRCDSKVTVRTNWGELLRVRSLSALTNRNLFGGSNSARTIIMLALTGQLVESSFTLPLNPDALRDDCETIEDIERAGELFLEPSVHKLSSKLPPSKADEDLTFKKQFYVRVPFVQLVAAHTNIVKASGQELFPSHLLFSPSFDKKWSWHEFEQLHAYFQAFKIKALVELQRSRIEQKQSHLQYLTAKLKKEGTGSEKKWKTLNTQLTECRKELKVLEGRAKAGFTISEICCGALGHPTTLSRRVVLENFECFEEQRQWIPKLDEFPSIVSKVDCKRTKNVSLFKGVFLCCTGNSMFDGRFCCHSTGRKPILFVWQDKHPKLSASKTVSTEYIRAWHSNAQRVLCKWHGKKQTQSSSAACSADDVVEPSEQLYDVVYLFLTNRPLKNGEKFADLPEGLLVVTKSQLGVYLGPTLAGRGLIPLDTD